MELRLVSEMYNFSHHKSEIATPNYLIHNHDCYELYYVTGGDVSYLYDGTEYDLSPHTLLLIPPGVIHGICVRSEALYDRYTFHFVPGMFAKERQNTLLQILPTMSSARSQTSPIPSFIEHADRFQVQERLDQILTLSGKDRDMQILMAPILLEALIISLYLASSGNEQSIPHFSQPVPRELEKILDYLRLHPSDRITLEQLSSRFYISRSKLNNLFRKYFDSSVMDYVTNQRLSYAQKLLGSGMPAAQVASTIGYSDYSTFYRAYTKHIGHPPTEDKARAEAGENADPVFLQMIPFDDPTVSMRREAAAIKTTLPDIGFENNAYAPLDTY